MNNNKLTRFDVPNQTHELSALGGIPQGQTPDGSQNLVETGETKNGNFINSNRLFVNKDIIKAHNLPNYINGKSFAEASKLIDNKFLDRQDKYAQETRNTLLKRLETAQEDLKSQQQRINQSLKSNSQEIPEQSNGQIPEGFEEYSEQPQQEQVQQQPINTASPIAAFGGYQVKRYDNGGVLQNPSLANPLSAGNVMQGVGTLMDLGNTAFGKPLQDTSGQVASGKANAFGMIGSSALKGAAAGAQAGPLGAIIGGSAGLIAGGLGLGKERKAEALNTRNFAANMNRSLSDNYAAYGGYINQLAKGGGLSREEDRGSDKKPYPSVASGDFAGGGRSYPIPTRADAVDALRLAGLHGRSDVRAKVYAKYPDLKHADGGPINPPKDQSVIEKVGDYIGDKLNSFDPQRIVEKITPDFSKDGILKGRNVNGMPAADYANNVKNAILTNLAINYAGKKLGTKNLDDKYDLYQTGVSTIQRRPTQMLTQAIGSKIPGVTGNTLDAIAAPWTDKIDNFLKEKWTNTNQRIAEYNKSKKFADGGPMGPELSPDELSIRHSQGTLSDTGLTANLANQFKGASNYYDTNKPLFVDPTQGPIKLPQEPSLAGQVGQYAKQGLKTAGKAIASNAGEALRYAPIAMNAYQLATLGKSKGVQYAQSDARFKPSYVDEAQLQRIVDQEANNQIRGLQESGASEGAIRAATLGAGLNKSKALADAYMNAAAQNRATDVQGQQFNYAVDQANIERRNKAIDEMRMDAAARANAKSKLLATMGTDVGSIGKEISDAKLAKALTGYSRSGEYVLKPSGEKASPEETAMYNRVFPTTVNPTTAIKAMGGYLTTSKKYRK